MDPTLITAGATLLGVIGGGLGFLIRRADKRRETNETLLIAHLEAQLAAAEKESRFKDRIIAALRKDGDRWRSQLQRAGIDPMPAEWTEVLEEDS